MTLPPRKRRAHRAAISRIEDLKAELFLAYIAGDDDLCGELHAEIVDREHEQRLIETVRKYAGKAAAE